MVLHPLSLFVTHDGRSSRQSITCKYKCGDACAHPVPNTSEGQYFGDLARASLSRRGVLRGGALTVLAVGGVGALAACSDDASAGSGGQITDPLAADPAMPGTNFEPVAPNTDDAVTVPTGYEQQVVIRWGEPIVAGAAAFDAGNQSAAAQEQQFGYNCDFAGFVPVEGTAQRQLMIVNHEYTTEPLMFAGYDAANPTEEQVRIAWAAHGLSVVEVEGRSEDGRLDPVIGRYNRRITATTPMAFTGPAAGSALLHTTADPAGTTVAGTLNNCAGCITPWGTVLSGEENFHQYFGHADRVTDPAATAHLERYGFADGESERKWERFDARFDLGREPNEANRFGYMVEIDPFDPTSVPVKHTALGRFKHEAANIYVTDDGTVVAYSGDDERFEYIYKFVSSKTIQPGAGQGATRENMTIMAEGTLYVAQITGNSPAEQIDGSGAVPEDGRFDGTGRWIPLLRTLPGGRGESLVEGMSAEEVAVFTREAADRAGATKMDRPEDSRPNPTTGKIYIALTNNTRRGTDGNPAADEANPRNENKNGQVIEITDDHTGTEFTWELLLVCGDPQAADSYFGGFDKSAVSPISCPDNVAFDDHGNLWISTDGNALGSNDGLFSVVLDGERRGETKQFLTVPIGAETCGPNIGETRVVVCVQHPGESDDATLDNPLSHWPDGAGTVARPSVISVWRDGGRIGI
ncbi:PhoX family protein [Rhodococcus artemisiae]|uniref:PhoX family phosphatase n=1 Tax=Rhodococcus artemisiae TaxID=714159 RepID=A0ABU7LJV3_9NOCA|nr:PhoX family phosphatase [Rhodococcus artemisiae]MEE2061780.1 PhoX family phosphatase [Rhodococcus artemisiae]